MYKELLIFPDGLRDQMVYPDVARELVAEAADAFPVNPLIFNRMPDGKTVQGTYGSAEDGEGWGIPPRIFFGGGRGFIRITGLGAAGAALLEAEAATIGTAVAMKLGTPYSFKMNEGECEVKRSRPHLYRVKQLVLSKKTAAMNAHKSADGRFTRNSVEPLIRRAVIGGIISQARFLDEQCHGPAVMEAEIGTDDMLGLRILEGEVVIGKIKKDARVHALIVTNLVFSVDLELKGPWLSGLLRSRGYGLIRKELV